MGIIPHERKVLREAYVRADDALAVLDDVSQRDISEWIALTADDYRDHQSAPATALVKIAQTLRDQPEFVTRSEAVIQALAHVLLCLHDASRALHDLHQSTEEAIQITDTVMGARPH